MSRSIRFFLFLAVVVYGSGLYADPIQDLSMNKHDVGWYPNFYKGKGPLTCPRTCEIWVGSPSESEESFEMDEQTKRTHVCKVTRDEEIILKPINDPKSHWLYGNQFDDYPLCFVYPAGYKPFKSELFMCECVRKSPCGDLPDLVIANIADPVWDNAAQVSIVSVTVANIGGAAAGAFQTRLVDTGTGVDDTQSVSGLAAGGSVTLTFTFNYWVFDPNAELTATADSKKGVKECQEDNNTLSYLKLG